MGMFTEISSDQNVPLSKRVTAARRTLRQELDEAGLARVADDLEKLMVVSIRMNAELASEGEFDPGSSKLAATRSARRQGWPECGGVAMALLAQLRMQDAAPYDPDGRLPKSGMLYFFYEAKDQKWGFDPKHRGHWKVIYHDGDLAGLQITTPPDNLPEESRFQECKVAFSNEITLPSWESKDVEPLNLSEAERDGYMDFPGPIVAKAGRSIACWDIPNQIQGEMKFECQLASNGIYVGDSTGYTDPRLPALEKGADDWQLLLQIDSDDPLGMMWGDTGRVYFWVRKQDLARKDFSNVWLSLQCY